MESAARRAREGAGGTPPAPSPAATAASSGNNARDRDGTPDRWLVGAVITVAALVVAASVGLVVSLTAGEGGGPGPSTVAAPGQTGRPATTGPGAGGSGHHGGTPTTPTSRTTPPAQVPPTPGGVPVISGLDPSSGPAGQGIQVSGGNFLSSTGQIVATFNGQVAPTRCPAQNTCTVTVPPLPGSSSAQVVITTSAGASNPVTFTYD